MYRFTVFIGSTNTMQEHLLGDLRSAQDYSRLWALALQVNGMHGHVGPITAI